MFVLTRITGEMEWLPRSMCFVEGDDDGGGGGEDDDGNEDEGGGGTDEVTDWRKDVPDELKATADRFTSRDDALRAIQDLRKRESHVRVPAKDADEDAVAAYHKAIGVPENVEGYEFPELEDGEMTEEIKADREGWAKAFHEHNIPKAAADALIQRFFETQTAGQEAVLAADKKFADDETAKLKTDWGGDFDANKTISNRALTDIATRAGVNVEDLKQIETKDGRFLFDNAMLSRMFALVGREMAEGHLGGVGEGERETIEGQIKTLAKKAEEASASGDRKEANALYTKEQALRAKLAA